MSRYRALVQTAGPFFLVMAFFARLPAAMGPLGVVTLVAVSTGSFAVAGAVAAAFGLGAAVGGPIVGALADRHGQRLVGVTAAVIDAMALAAVVLAVTFDAAPVVVALVAALAGFANPQVGPLVRVRWAGLFSDPSRSRTLPTAFSYEGAADELSYMAGPALVGIIALAGPPGLPLIVAAGLLLVAAIPFALHRTAVPPVRAAAPSHRRDRLPKGAVALLVAAMAVIGVLFGATQTGVMAYAEESGMPGAAGLIYAVLGVGSAAAGVATAWLPARWGPILRYATAAVALAGGAIALAFLGTSLTGVLVAMAVLGVVSAPYLIAVNALASAIGPARRASAVMTLVASGVVAGVAAGAAVAGRLADAYGYGGAFAVPAFASLAGLALAAASRRLLAPALRSVAPAPAANAANAPAPTAAPAPAPATTAAAASAPARSPSR